MEFTLSLAGEMFIKSFEGFSLVTYKDQAGRDTIYFGHLVLLRERFSHTTEDAERVFQADTASAVNTVGGAVTVEINQNQFDALTDLCFNIGNTHFRNSTLLRLLCAGDYDGAANSFIMWNKVVEVDAHGNVVYNPDGTPAHVVSAGLTSRRLREKSLFLSPLEQAGKNI